MARVTKKQRGVFERPKGSGIWWICYFDQYGRKHREKVGMKSAAINVYHQRKTEIRQGRFEPFICLLSLFAREGSVTDVLMAEPKAAESSLA